MSTRNSMENQRTMKLNSTFTSLHRRSSVQKLQGTVFGHFTGSANKIPGCRAPPKERPQSAFTVRAIYARLSSVGPHARTVARRHWQKAELLLAKSSWNYPKLTGRIWRLSQGHEWTVLKRSSAHWTQHSTKSFLDLYAYQNVQVRLLSRYCQNVSTNLGGCQPLWQSANCLERRWNDSY